MYSFHQILHKHIVWDCSLELNPFVDYRFGYTVDIVALRQLGKLACFNSLRPDMRIEHGQLVSRAHGTGAVWSGRCDKNLDGYILLHLLDLLNQLRRQLGLAVG